MRPSNEELKQFIDGVKKLDLFEADHRNTCGWGAWDEEKDPLPNPSFIKTLKWLSSLSTDSECEGESCLM